MISYSLKIRGPKQGYLTKEKAIYRKNVWDNIKKAFNYDLSDKKALIFPSNHDEEIKIALNSGIKEKNLWACDEKAAILATAKWRKTYPEINILGVKLERAIGKLYSKGIKIDIANFDFCSNLCATIFKDTANFINFVASDYFCFGITILKGREPAFEALLAKMLFSDIEGTINRVKILSHFLQQHCEIRIKKLFQSEYKSGPQYMSYGIYKTVTIKAIEKAVLEIFEANHDKILKLLKRDDKFLDMRHNRYRTKRSNLSYSQFQKEQNKAFKKLQKLLDLFWKERNALEQYIDSCCRQVDGWSSGYKGRDPFIFRGSSDAVNDYMNLIDIKSHRF